MIHQHEGLRKIPIRDEGGKKDFVVHTCDRTCKNPEHRILQCGAPPRYRGHVRHVHVHHGQFQKTHDELQEPTRRGQRTGVLH